MSPLPHPLAKQMPSTNTVNDHRWEIRIPAFPPLRRISRPAAVARGWDDATTPFVPYTTDLRLGNCWKAITGLSTLLQSMLGVGMGNQMVWVPYQPSMGHFIRRRLPGPYLPGREWTSVVEKAEGRRQEPVPVTRSKAIPGVRS
jgi:hypothetical protein